MKTRILSTARLSLPLASGIVAMLASQSANAQVYWDTATGSAGFGTGTGTWGTSAFWSNSSTGATGATFITATSSSSNVNFGSATNFAASGAIGIATGGVSTSTLTFGSGQTTALTIGTAAGPAITFGGGTRTITNAPTVTGGGNNIIAAPIIITGNLSVVSGRVSNTSITNLSLGAISGTGNLTFTTPSTTSSNGNTQFVTLTGAGTWIGNTTLSNAAEGGNSLVNGSGAANVLPVGTVLSFSSSVGRGSGRSTSFDMNGQNQTLAGLSGTGALPALRSYAVSSATAATLTIDGSGSSSYGGATLSAGNTTSAQITGAISLTKSGSGTFTLGGTLTGGATAQGNTFTGDTKINAGILVLGESISIRNSAFDTSSIAGDASNGLRVGTGVTALTLGGLKGANNFSSRFTSTTGGYDGLTALTLNPGSGVTHTYSADIGDGAGNMTLTKTGAGTQILAAAQTYTGATTVTAGVLAVNGTLASVSTTVSGTGTLKGSGSMAGPVTIESGGTLASGNSIESLATGALSFTTGSTFQYELDKSVAASAAGDLTAVSGNLSLTGTVTLSLVELGTSGAWDLGSPLGDHLLGGADKLTLISYSGTWNGGRFTYGGNEIQDDSSIIFNGQQWWFNYNDTDAGDNFTGDLTGSTFVTMTVPEPGAALLGGLGLLALLRRRRH